MPPFKLNIMLERRCLGDTLRYTCNCSKPYGLFCQALKVMAMGSWMQKLDKYINEALKIEPKPKRFISNFYNLDVFIPDPLFNYNHVMACIYKILSNREVQENYALSYDGTTVTLYAQPKFLTHEVHTAAEMLETCKRKLPCRFVLILYPFIYIDIKSE